MTPQVLDLFSGIGGFALAFEAAGFKTHAFAEIEPYPCKVLAQHWPDVPNLGDVRGIHGEDYRGRVAVVCGGFPCQDISAAGKGAGLEGARSGLWFEMLRIIQGARPDFCLIENVPALRTRGADRVLADLEESGYTGRPFVVGAVHAGAPHRRQRVWIVAYSNSFKYEGEPHEERGEVSAELLAHCTSEGGQRLSAQQRSFVPNASRSGEVMADAEYPGLEEWGREAGERSFPSVTGSDWWATEPALGRVAHGVPHRAHRIKALGNSIAPAVAYPFARFIYQQLGC